MSDRIKPKLTEKPPIVRKDIGRPQGDAIRQREGQKGEQKVHRNDAFRPKEAETPDKKPETEKTSEAKSEKGFINQKTLEGHYNKHRNEFHPPFTSKEAYEQSAKNFMSGETPPGVLEKKRDNGDTVRYNPKTEEFGTARKDGTIRTYFIPDPAGHKKGTNLDYFNRQ